MHTPKTLTYLAKNVKIMSISLGFVCIFGLLLSSCGSTPSDSISDVDDTQIEDTSDTTETADDILDPDASGVEVVIDEDAYENLATGEKAAFDRYQNSEIPEEDQPLTTRAIRAGLIGDYRKMLRICAKADAGCKKTFISIDAPHTGTSSGSLVAPSEYSVDVVGFQTTETSASQYSASSYENMPYRILALKPGYLTDMMTWYHQGSTDDETTMIEFLPVFVEPTTSWDLSGSSVNLEYEDITITGTLTQSRGTTLYLYDYSINDLLDLNHGIVLADSVVDGLLQDPPPLNRLTIIQAWRDGELIDTMELQLTNKDGPITWKFDTTKGLWISDAQIESSSAKQEPVTGWVEDEETGEMTEVEIDTSIQWELNLETGEWEQVNSQQ